MKGLVITSINPYSKIEYQKVCFNAWKALGYDILSFNSENERNILLENGFESEDVCLIELGETAFDMFGKQIPRILPVLNRVFSLSYDSYILTNSDIFPAHRKQVFSFLKSIGDCLALTRNESMYVPCTTYLDSTPYRGGLDVFFFSKEGLTLILKVLSKVEVAERMTFGIPGWDYFLGFVILNNGGLIMDGEIFLHQSHPTSYGKIDEFQFYANEMYRDVQDKSKDVNAIANEFSQSISGSCEKNLSKSRLLKRMFWCPPTLDRSGIYTAEINNLINDIVAVLKTKEIDISLPTNFNQFLFSQSEQISWAAAEVYRKNSLGNLLIVQSSMLLILSQLIIKKLQGRLFVSRIYPAGNMHGAALRQIINNTQGAERLKYLLGLFASELIEHSIFNAELFKYFVLSCKSNRTLAVCAAVLTLCN